MNGKWRGWGVSEIGPFHIKNNIPNQDSFIIKKFSWGLVGAVCDGLGSKKYSDIGSKKLCEAVVNSVKIFDFEKDLSLFDEIVISLWKMKLYPINLNEALSTLLLVIVKDNKIYIANSGDGGIVTLDKEFIFNENGEFSNITSPFSYSKLKWRVFNEDEISAIMLCSDGVYDDLKKDKIIKFAKDYVAYYKNMNPLKRNREIKNLLQNWPVKGHSDDKTILVLFRD